MTARVFILAALFLLSMPTVTEQGIIVSGIINTACMAACVAAVGGTSVAASVLFPLALFASVSSVGGCGAACTALALTGLVTNPV